MYNQGCNKLLQPAGTYVYKVAVAPPPRSATYDARVQSCQEVLGKRSIWRSCLIILYL